MPPKIEISLHFPKLCCFHILKIAGDLGEFNHGKNPETKCFKSSHVTAAGVSEKAGSVGISSPQESLVVEDPIKVKIEDGENTVDTCLGDWINISSIGIEANSEAETRLESLNELDHVVLKERLRRLVRRFIFIFIFFFLFFFL